MRCALISTAGSLRRSAAAGVASAASAIRTALTHGTSQSGRYLRTFLLLGFNRDERDRSVFDGMNPHLASQLIRKVVAHQTLPVA